MTRSTTAIDTLTKYEWLLRLSAGGRERLTHGGRPVRVAPSVLLLEGDACGSVTLLAEGLVRVTKRRPSGRAITLYTVEPGELCVLEVLAVLTGRPFRAEAAVVAEATGLTIPADLFRGLVNDEPHLRDALFGTFEARLAAALELVGEVALETLESRLATLLLRRAHGGSGVYVTHEQLAYELACAREAVSRILEHWERAGHVQLRRGHIHVTAARPLSALAGDPNAPVGRRI